MIKIVILALLSVFSYSLVASEVNCFADRDDQIHLAVGDVRIANFSFTSFLTSRKISHLLEEFTLGISARSGTVDIENQNCTESESEIKCDIYPNTKFTIFNIFRRAIISKSGLVGFLRFDKRTFTLRVQLENSLEKKIQDEIVYDSSQCRVSL